MTNIAKNIVDKRAAAVLIDGKCISDGLELQEQWTPYIFTKDEEQAKNLYQQERNIVVCGNVHNINISINWAKAAIFEPENYTEFEFFCKRVSELEGIVIYSYDKLFDATKENELKKHFDACTEVFQINNIDLLQENGKNYLIGYRMPKGILFRENFETFKKLFVGPYIDAVTKQIKIKGIKSRWFHPAEFQEKKYPAWKTEMLFEQETTSDKLFTEGLKPKFMGGTIEIPNHEQLAILLASGAIDQEVELADGRIVVLKGTEMVSHEDHIKFDLDGNPVAKVDKQIRNTLLYELDLTNATFSKLS